MRDALTLLLQWWIFFFGGILAVGVIAYVAAKILGKLKKLFRKVALVVVAFVAVIYGGTKSIANRFTADQGLTITKAELTIPTNDVDNAFLTCSWIGPDESQPLRVRENVHESWAYLGEEWLFDDRIYANGTNTATWWVDAPASNIVPYAMYHLGSDLPPVEIDGEGVTIEQFTVTSKYAMIRYAVNPAALTGAGAVSIEAQSADSMWMEVYRLAISQPVTNTVAFPGFWVGNTTRWRVRLEVGE